MAPNPFGACNTNTRQCHLSCCVCETIIAAVAATEPFRPFRKIAAYIKLTATSKPGKYNINAKRHAMRLKVITRRSRKTTIRDKMKKFQVYSTMSGCAATPCVVPSSFASPAVEAAAGLTAIAGLLTDAGVLVYLASCNRSEDNSRLLVQRCAQFIVWSYAAEYDAQMIPTEENVTSWFGRLAMEKYGHLLAFAQYLRDKRNLQPSTVRNYAADITKLFSWGSLFAPVAFKLPLNSDEGIRAVAEIVRANQTQRMRRVHSENTWAAQVQHRRLPAGGLADLQAAALEELPWARSVRSCDIDDVAYRTFMQLTVSAIYVFSANGRQSGVADVRMGQVEDMLKNGYTTSSKFKTNSKYGYQPITLGAVSRELLHLYVTVVRPQVCRHHPIQPSDHLWLTYRGEIDLTVGKLVTAFFIRKCGLSVTTTGIRGLVETEMDKKHKSGVITEAEKNAVHNINGHTSAVTRDYYLFEDRASDVARARSAFGELHRPHHEHAGSDLGYVNDVLENLIGDGGDGGDGDGDCDDTDCNGSELPVLPQPLAPALPPLLSPQHRLPAPLPLSALRSFLPSPVPAVLDWGTAHPDYKTARPTAQWTHEEKQYIGTWCARFSHDYPDTRNVVAKCLKHLHTDPRAVSIFHAHHTLNSARLRNGLRQFTAEAEETERRLSMHRYTDAYSEEMY